MPLTEDRVRNAVVTKLASMKYRPHAIKSRSEHGVDIKARHERFSRYFLVEVKGEPSDGVKSASAGREVRFLQGLGQLITRIQPERGYYYGLAFPSSYRDTVLRRHEAYGHHGLEPRRIHHIPHPVPRRQSIQGGGGNRSCDESGIQVI